MFRERQVIRPLFATSHCTHQVVFRTLFATFSFRPCDRKTSVCHVRVPHHWTSMLATLRELDVEARYIVIDSYLFEMSHHHRTRCVCSCRSLPATEIKYSINVVPLLGAIHFFPSFISKDLLSSCNLFHFLTEYEPSQPSPQSYQSPELCFVISGQNI